MSNTSNKSDGYPALSLPPLKTENFKFLSKTHAEKVNLYYGTIGWNDKTYIGKIYPHRTKKADFLKYYSSKFNSVFVNSTKFKIPDASELAIWKSSTPKNFKFVITAPQYLTHNRKVNEDGVIQDLQKTIADLDVIRDKLAFLYFPFSSTLKPSRLDELFEFLIQIPEDFPIALSFRNSKLFNSVSTLNNVNKRLAALNMAFAFNDTVKRRDFLTQLTPTTSSLIILFSGSANDDIDAKRVKDWVELSREYIENGVKNIYFLATQPTPVKHRFDFLLETFKSSFVK